MLIRRMVRPGSNRRLVIEALDARLPMAANLVMPKAASFPVRTLPGMFGPVQPVTATTLTTTTSTTAAALSPAAVAAAAPSSTPFQFSSNPGAPHTLYLDFNGHNEPTWAGYTPGNTGAYDIDGNLTLFNDLEQKNIEAIARQVAEDYAPFRVNVTTVEPSTFGPTVVRVVIGGEGGWYSGSSPGGVALLGTYGVNNVAFVFSDNLLGPKFVADAVSHEAGHIYGLDHQSVWSGSTRVQEYNTGTAASAPLMGLPFQAQRSTWWVGQNAANVSQNDFAILTNVLTARADDFSSLASNILNQVGNGFADKSGIIESATDIDPFTYFVSGPGVREFALNIVSRGNLLPSLQLKNSSGVVLATASASPSNNGSVWLSYNFAASGSYILEVKSASAGQASTLPGDVGQYTLTSRQDSDFLIGLAGAGWWGTSLNTGETKLLSTWSTAVTWNNPITGDFNGDGATDFAAQANGVQWWFGLSGTGNTFSVTAGTSWPAGTTLIGARDVNGDKRDDIVGFTPGNRIITSVSTSGTPFNSLSNAWSTAVTWGNYVLGDFNGDGMGDFAGRVQNDGNWWVTLGSTSTALAGTPAPWGRFPLGTYREMSVADVNGDGRDDMLGRMSNDTWYIGLATTSSFQITPLVIAGSGSWTDVRTGDLQLSAFPVRSRPLPTKEIIGRDSSGNWQMVQFANVSSLFVNAVSNIGSWSGAQYANVMVRDIDRDGVFELIGRQTSGPQAGVWRIDRLSGTSLVRDARAIRNPAWANIAWYADIGYDDGDIF